MILSIFKAFLHCRLTTNGELLLTVDPDSTKQDQTLNANPFKILGGPSDRFPISVYRLTIEIFSIKMHCQNSQGDGNSHLLTKYEDKKVSQKETNVVKKRSYYNFFHLKIVLHRNILQNMSKN